MLKGNQGGKALKWLPAHSNFEERNAPKSERERPSTLRDWPPCPPIQLDGGWRSRPGANPFISVLTVARCPAIFPGVRPLLRDTLSTSRSVGRGMGAFIYLPPFSENSPIFRSFPFAKIQPVFLTEQTGAHEAPHPVFPVSHASRYNTLHFASKVVCQRGHPFGNPRQQNRRYAALSGSIPPFVVSSPFHGLRVVPCKLT